MVNFLVNVSKYRKSNNCKILLLVIYTKTIIILGEEGEGTFKH